jgi:adenine/guanine phosphoribosyltransferase-like PRPP-binding protein
MAIVYNSYIEPGFQPEKINAIVSGFGEALRNNVFDGADGIICRGTSGLIIAPILAFNFNLKLVVARKGGDGSHSPTPIEGCLDCRKLIFVDDFISTGSTFIKVCDIVQAFGEWRYEKPIVNSLFLWRCEFSENRNVWKFQNCQNVETYRKYMKGKICVSHQQDNKIGYKVEEHLPEKKEVDLGELLARVM